MTPLRDTIIEKVAQDRRNGARQALSARNAAIYALQRQLVGIVESANAALAVLSTLTEPPRDPREVEAPPKRLGRSST